MKLTLLLILAALAVVSCGKNGGTPEYYNRPDGCQIGETIILNAPSHADNVYNAGF